MSRLGSPIVGQTSRSHVEVFATAFPDMHRELYSFYDVGDHGRRRARLAGKPTRGAGIASGNCAANRKADGRTVL